MLTRPNPRAAKTPKAASRSRPRVSGRRRVTRAGVPSARSFARRARWLGDRFGVCSGVMILPFDTLTYPILQRIVSDESADNNVGRPSRGPAMTQTLPQPPPQPAPATRQRFLAEFLDAFDRRTFLLVIAVLLIQASFVL